MLTFSLGSIIFQLIIMLILAACTLFVVVFMIKFLFNHRSPSRSNKEILDKLDEISKKLDQRK